MKPILPALACLLALAAAAPAAAADPLLTRLQGDWVGRGSAKRSATAAPELVYCKISGKLDAAGNLEQSGRCAFGNDSGSLNLKLGGQSGRYAGTIKVPGRGESTISGAGSEAGIELSADAGNAEPRARDAQIRLRFTGEQRYALTTAMKESAAGPAYEVGTITFTRE